jgi:hypothetical protein
MVITVAEVSAVISLSALGTAIYGIFERGAAARRAERTRLTTIVENTAKARGELMKLSGEGVTTGNAVEIIHAQQELLAQQARSLIKDHRLTITST